MSWLESSPKRPLGKSKDVSHPGAKGGWGSTIPTSTRTYGSTKRRTAATVRNSSASRGLFAGGSKPTASSMHEEDATAVSSGDSSRLLPPLDSFRKGASLVSYGSETDFRVEAGSPEEEGSPPSILPKNDGLRISRAVKPSNMGVGGRSRRAPCRARGAAAEDAPAVAPCGTKSSGREASGVRGEVSKRRGAGARKNRSGGGVSAVALDSGGDAGEQTGSGSVSSTGTKLSPSKRRERSPGRKGGGRPERGVDRATPGRKPSSRLQSPLRSITNNSSSEGDRGCTRSKSKSGAVGGTAESPADSGSSSSGEEWQDNANRPKRREKMMGSPQLDAQEDGGVQSPLPVQRTLEELEELEGSPLQAMTPSRSPPRAAGESSFSLDSSLEGILVGDKRPRGNSRGKRTARGTEESAHRSSRSRHLSPMIPVTAGSSSHAFAVDEEGGDSEAAIVDLMSPTVAGYISTTAEATKLAPEAPVTGEKEPPKGNGADLLPDSESSTMQVPAPSARLFHLRRAASVGSFGTTPALSHSTSPRLTLKRPSRREGDGVTITPALGKATAARELEEWGESPPPRLSRSLSLSQTSAWSGSGGSGSGSGSGCGKVTRISSRRRSRASSTSSPLPVPELSVSLTAGSMGEKLSALTTGGSGSRGSRSVGCGGGTRREQRRLRTSMIASLEGLGEQLLGDIGTASSRGVASSLRCHQMVSMGQAQPVRRERPTSLPNGLDLSNLGEVELADRGELDEACLGGDPGVGWVLRAPGAPLLGERSRSFASTFQGLTHGERMRPLTVLDGTDGVMTASGMSSSSSRIQRSSRRTERPGGPDLDGGGRVGALEFSPRGMYVTSTRTPQSSYRTISAVRHRSSNLSSVARRMDRLEIRSDHVDTQATQAQKAIMGSPGEQQWSSSGTPSAMVTSASTSASTGASDGGLGTATATATTSATREPAPETSPRGRAPQAATPTRARSVVLPQLHLTPLEPSNERLSMGSVAACSPSACLRDYLSGSYRRPEEAPLEEECTPSTPSMRITASSVGIRRARSTTASASSPVVPRLFGSSRKGCVGTDGTSFAEGAELDLPRRVKDSRGNGSVGSGLVDSRVQSGRAVSPAKPQKGMKSRPQPKTTSVSSGAIVGSGGCSAAGLGDSGEDGPECGFLIRRKSMGHASSASPDWKNSLGYSADTTRSPAHFPRFGLGNTEGGTTGSLGSGGYAEMQSPVLESQDRDTRRRRNFSSPFPLASGDECGTPSAFLNGRGGRDTVGTTKLSSDNAGDTDPASADSGEALLSRMGDNCVHEMGSSQRPTDNSPTTAPAAPDVAAVVSAASESRPRRNSIESVGCTTGDTSSRPQFETPQPETKLRWGSRPQYGDWGISQPASARTLKRLAGRLMAFAGRAAGGRFSCETPDCEQRLLTHASPGVTPQRPFSALAATSTDTTPRGDSRLPRPSPGSSRSNHRQSFGFRNSLGTLSERGEFGMGMLTPKAEVEVSGDAEQVTEDDDAVEGLDVAEAGMMGEGVVNRGGEKPQSGSAMRGLTLEVVDAIGRDGEGNDQGFPGLGGLMSDDQREAYRRRQKKAKMRRVSMSIKSRKSSGAVLGALAMAGGNVRCGSELSLLEVAEAESPGLVVATGKAHGRHRNHRRETTDGNLATGRERQRARGFVGARESVISEREDEDEEENELDSTPVAAEHGPGGHAYSPSSLERRCGSGKAKMRLVEEGKGETPAKVREDLERSLTELNNLSLSMCHSESDDSPSKCGGTPSKSFTLGLESLEDRVQPEPAPVSTIAAAPASASVLESSTCDGSDGSGSVAAGRHTSASDSGGGGKGSFEFLQLDGVMAKVLCMLSFDELLGDLPVVCMAWRRAATLAFAEVASESGDRSDGARPGDGDSDGDGDGDDRRRRRRGRAAAGAAGTIPSKSASRHQWTTRKLVEVFPWGGFLSEGSFKQVFKVWNALQSRMEALSVMNRELVAESGSEEVVSQELRVSILASSLVQRGICPNFVQTFGLFRSDEPPPPKVFGDSEVKYPCGRSPGVIRSKPHSASACRRAGLPLSSIGRSRSTGDGELRYQFIGMELCQYGDAEALIRAQPDGLLSLHEATACLFQMAFALYAGRVELSLRHADVKLLNFLVANGAMVGNGQSLPKTHGGRSSRREDVDDRELPSTRSEMGGDDDDGDGEVVLVYGIGREVVQLRMPEDRAFVVKLADFGTADVNPATIGESVCAGHFTTLENTPMEHLSCGHDAQQTYAGDTFALALAAVHLFTGDVPYEELMEEVECPDELYDALANAWSDHLQYSMICDIILDGVPDEEGGGDDGAGDEQREDDGDDQDPTLMNTFYRYLVLFGVPDRQTIEDAYGPDNAVWSAVGNLMGWVSGRPRVGGRGGRRAASASAASKLFCRRLQEDQARFSLASGSDPLIARGRARLEAVPGAMNLVTTMASFAPSRRPTMLDVLRHEAFSGFRQSGGLRGGGAGQGRRGQHSRTLEFMSFARHADEPPLVDV